jgi:hypothetical protein
MSRRASTIVTIEKNVSCIKGYESFDTASISKRLPRKFYLKSYVELEFEKQKREGKIPVFKL